MSNTNNLGLSRSEGFQSSLPRLPVLLTYIDKSYTKVKLASSLAERVTFFPWTDFDREVSNVKRQIDFFPTYVCEQSQDILQRLRATLDPLSVPVDEKSVKMNEFYRQRKRRLSADMSFQNREVEMSDADRNIPGDGQECDETKPDTNDSLKGKLVFTCSSSCEDVNCKVFDVVQDLTRALTACRDLHIVSQLQVNSEVGRAYDVLSPSLSFGPSDHCTLTPDKALTLTTERPASSLPICAYELKGPLQFFWNAKNPVLPTSVTKKRRGREDEEVDPTNGSTDHSIGRITRTGSEENYTAIGMSNFFNDVFKERKDSPGKRQENVGSYLFLRIAQAVSQALLTDSGCGVLYNHDEAVAFQVFDSSGNSAGNLSQDDKESTQTIPMVGVEEGSVTNAQEQTSSDHNSPKSSQGQTAHKKGSLSVLVSRLFACDEEPSNICALLAISTHSYNLAVGDPKKKLQVRAAFQEATRTLVEQKTTQLDASVKRNFSGKSNEFANENSVDKTTSAGTSRSHVMSDVSNLMQLRPQDRDGLDLTKVRTVPGDTVSSDGSIASVLMEDESTSGSSGTTEDDDPTFWKTMASIIRNNFGVIGHGATSVVIGSRFDGREVAVKSWNGVDKAGMFCLVNEIRIYRDLHDQLGNALGVVIPQLRMSKVTPYEDATLVVDLVGVPVRRRYDGCLVTEETDGDKRLDVRDIQAICEAALKSLRVLHRCGVLHGDVELKNLRVDQEGNEEAQKSWRVWWIDLGLAKIRQSDPIELEIELCQCASLFPEARVDLSITTA